MLRLVDTGYVRTAVGECAHTGRSTWRLAAANWSIARGTSPDAQPEGELPLAEAAGCQAAGAESRRNLRARVLQRSVLSSRRYEVRLDPSGAIHEQAHGVSIGKALQILTGFANLQRRQRDQLLALDGHPFAPGGQYDHAGTFPFDASDESGDQSEYMGEGCQA